MSTQDISHYGDDNDYSFEVSQVLESRVGPVLMYAHVYLIYILSIKGRGLGFASPA